MNKVIVFILGAATGAGAMAYICRTKYETMIQEELDDIKEAYNEKLKEALGDDEDVEIINGYATTNDPEEKPNLMEYASQPGTTGYTDYAAMSTKKESNITSNDVVIKEELNMSNPKITVISPDEFGDDTDYDTISLRLYNDGIVTDEDGDPIKYVEDLIGVGSLNRFGEYEDDSVFIRNDINHTYYEVLRDESNYSEV